MKAISVKRQHLVRVLVAAACVCIVGVVLAAQSHDRFTLETPNGIAFSEFGTMRRGSWLPRVSPMMPVDAEHRKLDAPRGVSSRDEIMRAFHQPPPELAALERRDLVALDEILARLTPVESEQQSSSPYSANVATKRAGPRPARRRRQPRRTSSG